MDTLTVIQAIINLGSERDSLRDQLFTAKEEIKAVRAGGDYLQSRCETQTALIEELRIRNEQLHADLDAARSPASVSPTEPAVMTREQILNVAREALGSGRKVRAKRTNCWQGGDSHDTTTIYAVDGTEIPVALTRDNGGPRWCHLTCEVDDQTEGLASLELI